MAAALDQFIAGAEAAADVAGAVVRPLFRAAVAVDTKSDRSPVTIADRSAEQAMRAVLAERFPDHGVLGEEFGLDRPEARLRWVLDPIDGTRAFVSGRPTFGTLIALMDGETPIVGVIDQPVSRERWIGAAGRKTVFYGGYGGRAGCRRCPSVAEAELSCTSPEMLGPDMPRWQRLVAAVRRNYWGGDCYAHGLLALGQIDVITESHNEPVGLGGAGAGGRGRRRQGHRLVRPAAPAGRRWPGALRRRSRPAGGCCRAA